MCLRPGLLEFLQRLIFRIQPVRSRLNRRTAGRFIPAGKQDRLPTRQFPPQVP